MKILLLGQTASGKTMSIFPVKELGIKGLNPEETVFISCSTKILPVAVKGYKKISSENGKVTGNYYRSNSVAKIAKVVKYFASSNYKNLVIDDMQFLMGDYYMAQAGLGKNNFDIFKEIGGKMGLLFNEIEAAAETGKNIIVTSHYEVVENESGLNMIKPKTAGKAVDNYLTLEGRFDIIIYSVLDVDSKGESVYKFITKPIGAYHNIRAPYGLFDKAEYPNDMGLIIDIVNKYQANLL